MICLALPDGKSTLPDVTLKVSVALATPDTDRIRQWTLIAPSNPMLRSNLDEQEKYGKMKPKAKQFTDTR